MEAQISSGTIPGLTPEDLACRKRLTGELYRHRSLDSFRLMMHQEYEASTNDASREKLLEFWANHLVVSFGEYDESNALIDSLLSIPGHFLGDYSRQSLEVRQFSNYSDRSLFDKLEIYTDTFLTRIETGNLRLNDTIDYFVLAIVLSEVNEFAAAQEVLSIIAYHSQGRPKKLWRTYLTMASLFARVDDYDKALEKTELFLPLTDTSKLNLVVCASAYTIAGDVYDHHKMYEQSYFWSSRALEHLVEGQLFEIKSSTAIRCKAAINLKREDVNTVCNVVLSEMRDTSLPDVIVENFFSTAFDYLLYDRRSVADLERLYSDWAELRKNGDGTIEYFDLDFLQASLRINMMKRDDRQSPAILDSLINRYEERVKNKARKTNNDLAEKYQSRIRQDSIANLTLRSQAAEDAATSRQRQLWLLLALLAVVVGGLFFALRESRRRKALNNELGQKNARITLLNSDINHRTSHYLTSIIKLLREQKYKMEEAGVATGTVVALERQTLVYTKLQGLLKTVDDRTVVELGDYLGKLTDMLQESFQGAGDPLQLQLQVDNLAVDPSVAAPLALILNELLTNTVKYAKRRGGIIHASFRCEQVKDGELLVNYEDDGPDESLDTSDRFSSNSGLELIEGLTHQLEADREVTDGFSYRARIEL